MFDHNTLPVENISYIPHLHIALKMQHLWYNSQQSIPVRSHFFRFAENARIQKANAGADLINSGITLEE